MDVAYQRAAFSATAVEALFPGADAVAHRTFSDVFAALTSGAARAAVVPVENTHAGSVVDVYDLLRTNTEIRVIGEAVIPIRQAHGERSVETAEDNFTRFFALARSDDDEAATSLHPAVAGGLVKTSLVYATRNVPGALLHSLQAFAVARIQLTKIESRPSRTSSWEYVFYLDFEGDPASGHVADALDVMRASCAWVRVLGTYPSAASVSAESVA